MDRQKDRREVWNCYLDNQKKVLAIWRKFYENNWPKNNLPAMASRITAINSTLMARYNFIIGIVFFVTPNAINEFSLALNYCNTVHVRWLTDTDWWIIGYLSKSGFSESNQKGRNPFIVRFIPKLRIQFQQV